MPYSVMSVILSTEAWVLQLISKLAKSNADFTDLPWPKLSFVRQV